VCTAAWQVEALFSGTVLDIRSFDSRKLVTFRVDILWRTTGTASATLDLETGGDCGVPFRVGGKYLVYAARAHVRDAAYLSTGICSNTRELARAADDLLFLERLYAGGQHSRISGQAVIRDAAGEWAPLAHVPIDLHRGDDTWSSITDGEGRSELTLFVGPPPGP